MYDYEDLDLYLLSSYTNKNVLVTVDMRLI